MLCVKPKYIKCFKFVKQILNNTFFPSSIAARMIMKKWTHIRDAWVKSMKYGYDDVTMKPPKPYVYHNELKFLQKILKCTPPRYNLNISQFSNLNFEEFYREKNETQFSNGTSNEVENIEDDNEFVAKNFKQEPNDVNESKITVENEAVNIDDENDEDDWHLEDTEITHIMEGQKYKQSPLVRKRQNSFLANERSGDEKTRAAVVAPAGLPRSLINDSLIMDNGLKENRHWNFFKGILPSLDGLDEDHVLNFQSGVIALLQKLRESQKQMMGKKPKRVSSRFLYGARGKRRKPSPTEEIDWAAYIQTRKKSTTTAADPIAPENDQAESSSDN